MKKIVLLSVVASTMIMAGGDIAPVEPVTETPAVQEDTSNWDFSGQGVVYYQTVDVHDWLKNGDTGLFKQTSSAADAGIRLRATTDNLIGGIGAGVAVNGLATLNLENEVVSQVMQNVAGNLSGAWISEAYVTANLGSTMVKLGRQTLPASLSPFAHSENWNVFANTYDAALVVNGALIPDTTLVGAWVYRNNQNAYFGDIASFNRTNNTDGVYMLTAQTKLIPSVTLTGSWYHVAKEVSDHEIFWADAQTNLGAFSLGLQGGSVQGDDIENTTAFGAKAGASFSGINVSAAYSHVNDSSAGVFVVGGQQTPLYTQMIHNESAIKNNANAWKVDANAAVLGGTVGVSYGGAEKDATEGKAGVDGFNELDVYYVTDIGKVNLLAGYVLNTADNADDVNIVRVVAKYKF